MKEEDVIEILNSIEASLVGLRLKEKENLSMNNINEEVFRIEHAVYVIKQSIIDKTK